MARKPIDVYKELLRIEIDRDSEEAMSRVLKRYSTQSFSGQNLSAHLSKFLGIFMKLSATLDSRNETRLSDLTVAIDTLDIFSSTSKWWSLTRKNPRFILRPPSHDPREFIISVSSINLGSGTISRIDNASERLSRFLNDHDLGDKKRNYYLCESVVSVWILLSAFAAKNQGRSATQEEDFEIAYDVLRILLFYTPYDDYLALTSSRRLGTNSNLHQAANISFAPGFEKQLESSAAAELENKHAEFLTQRAVSPSSSTRAILTNSLKLLCQLQAVEMGYTRVEEQHYGTFIIRSLEMLDKIGVSSQIFQNESAILSLFKQLKPRNGFQERLSLLSRRLEGLIVDSTGNRDFLLQYSRLVPRMISLLLLIACGTMPPAEEGLSDKDLKRGLILLNRLVSGQL
ncbi:MAG: hypothetical protein BAJATHORv1_20232 [Candidatus Thorarchaeota archaeon]|nr:MAG: hypothetical protein BAJATHORv1_20232 [Candidatus Thorarchaeota archaeon]